MSRDKHHNKKKHHKDTTNENENKNKRPQSRLFTEVDAKAADISDNTITHGSTRVNPSMQERLMPLGVVEIDESVKLPNPSPKLPNPSPKLNHQNHESKSYNSVRSTENHHTERVYLPSITQPHHYPYEYYYPSTDYYHSGHLSYPYPSYYEHHSPHHHHHQHHHRHHKHKKQVETYDPRWWYMPINSVHKPKLERPLEQHYAAPKWYESTNKLSRMQMNSQETKLSPQKYVDCRCEVCKPSKKAPHGSRWVVNE